MTEIAEIQQTVASYCRRNSLKSWRPLAALIDMDGVLYDSMPRHAQAWHRMMSEIGIQTDPDEFYLYEGMTGAATIDLLFERHLHRSATAEEVKQLYEKKSDYFRNFGARMPMPGAALMLRKLEDAGLKRVLVTGSAQGSLLTALEEDYPGAFLPGMRVTALDVTKGKPNPEPYLRGLEKAGVSPAEAVVIENAPLGVQAGHASGCFTVGLTTGPIPAEKLREAGADIIFPSMQAFADNIETLLQGYDC